MTKRLVLVGAGHAHVGVLRAFVDPPLDGATVTLVTPHPLTPYSGMLPGHVTGYYDVADIHIDTRPLARASGATLVLDAATGLDLERRTLRLASGATQPFDILSIDIGSTPGGTDIPGVAERAVPVKPIDGFLARLAHARAEIAAIRGPVRVAVVGGGAAGVELALALATRLEADRIVTVSGPGALRLTLLSAGPVLMPEFPDGVRRRLGRILDERGIALRLGTRVVGIDGAGVQVAEGPPTPADVVFWATQARPAPWLRDTGLALDPDGFIAVDTTLCSTSHPGVFAAGDVAAIVGHRVPKSGVYAVRQGPVLAENIRRLTKDRPLRRYRPQREALYLISTGARYAVGTRNGWSVEGAWVWSLKDWIDRRFMARFRFP